LPFGSHYENSFELSSSA